ncbi:MAG: hypothetical protein JO165_13160 [Candidatus Eremiobacteraeota bacterium]|nr:hypothetical protein [Candidatus Eremiobacteraeota bacterium]
MVRIGQKLFLVALLGVSSCIVACAPPPQAPEIRHLTVSAKPPMPWPSALVAKPDAAPQILRVWLSRRDLVPGGSIDGKIATSTNVASLEVRTVVFSINALRSDFGQFHFHLHILDVPGISRGRSYQMQIIARNTAGVENVQTTNLEMP